MDDIDIIEEESGYALCRKGDQFTVIRISRANGQVYSAMPTDGSNFAGISDFGVNYVAGWYSRSYARRTFRTYVTEAQDRGSYMSQAS
ncbi:hypothetical protein N9917_00315 [Deltaproteobacteria bacterium]|nr:hypothetical protein [Deltaproteobacteria bacterium]